MDSDDTDTMIEDCELRESHLSDAERTFIDSARQRRAGGRALSPPMQRWLEDIWNRVSSFGASRG